MAKKPGLGSAERYLIQAGARGWPIPWFRARPALMENVNPTLDAESPCQTPCQACGACCSYSQNWPRFTTEEDSALDLIPEKFVNDRLSGMRCEGDRCSALSGKVGIATSCTIYAVRPEVCRTCMPGDPECAMARRRHGLPVLASLKP
jgi:uncharacterized protein